MAVTTHALTGTISDLLGDAVEPRHTIAWVETNADGNVIVDTGTDGAVLTGSPRIDINDDGTFSVDLPTTAGATNPTGFQYRVWIEFRTIFGGKTVKKRWTSGYFSHTATQDLKDVIEEQYVPPTYISQATTALDSHAQDLEDDLTTHAGTLEGTLDGYATAAAGSATAAGTAADRAESEADRARSIADIEVPDDVMTVVDADPNSAFRQQSDARQITAFAPKTVTLTGAYVVDPTDWEPRVQTLVLTQGGDGGHAVTLDSDIVMADGVLWSVGQRMGAETVATFRYSAALAKWVCEGVWVSVRGLDIINPTAGTLDVSDIAPRAFTLTVEGATDTGGSGINGYDFSLNNGASWSGYQASNVYTPTGLTPETEYTVLWRVRDGDGNFAMGTPQTVTTIPTPLGEAILALNPVGYWKLDETSGTTAVDSSGNGHDGTYNGGVTLAGRDGYPLFGAGKSITIPDADALSATTGLTVFCVINRTHELAGWLVAKAAASNYEYRVSIGTTGEVAGTLWRSGGQNLAMETTTANLAPTLNEWKALAVAFPVPASGARFPIYDKTGAVATTQGTFTAGSYTPGTAPVSIGASSVPDNEFRGAIGHVAVFAGQLTAGQIQTLMDAAEDEGVSV